MKIRNRKLPLFIFLNCLTLGIYGFIVCCQIDKEVNYLCRGDGEAPRFTYFAAILFRSISTLVGLILGLIFSLGGILDLRVISIIPSFTGIAAYSVIISMFTWALICTLVGSLISGIYYRYWWYKQANRLKFNAARYGLIVKEGGIDHFLFRTALQIVLLPITLILFGLAFLIPGVAILLILYNATSVGALIVAAAMLLVFSLPLMLFGGEITAGADFSLFFMFKNLRRFGAVYKNGAVPFDRMGYQYYPSVENKYPNFLPGLTRGQINAMDGTLNTVYELIGGQSGGKGIVRDPLAPGSIRGVKGSCAGYDFALDPGEEIIIGKDAKVSQIVIDPSYKEISRKHVGVTYDAVRDKYRVVDYSSNGTKADGERLPANQPRFLDHGTELTLANGAIIFILG